MERQNMIAERLLLCLNILLAILMVVRVFFGTEQTDEAYYIAEARTVLEGNLPYAYNASSTVGMVFPMLPFMALYRLLVPDLTGVFLYMRICFVVFRMGIIALILWLLRCQYSRKALLLAGTILVVWFGSGIQNFNYASIASYLLLLTGVLLAAALEQGEERPLYRACAVGGVLMAFTEMAHVAMAPNVILFAVLLWLMAGRERRWKAVGFYLLGGLVTAVLILGIVGGLAGFDRLWYGLESLFFYNATLPNETCDSLYDIASSIWASYRFLWVSMLLSYVGSFLAWLLWRKFRTASVNVAHGACVATIFSLLGGCAFLLRFIGASALLQYIGAMALFASFGCLPSRPPRLFWVAAVPPIFITTMLAVFSSASNPPAFRFTMIVPALFVVVLHIGKRSELHLERWLLYGATALSVLLLLRYDFLYVYRDEPIEQLTARVDQGIYAGLYTTPQRAADMPELEAYLKEITQPEEQILFRDNVPAAYLMQDGVACDIRTWDHLQYSYGCNDPTPLYRYFLNRDQIPDKIIYVDYGRDEQLSIDDPEYRFNQFVERFYIFQEEQILNESYRVKVYHFRGQSKEDILDWVEEQMA